MSAYPGGDAARLLRSINAPQAHRRVGAIVFPFAAACSAGLEPGVRRGPRVTAAAFSRI